MTRDDYTALAGSFVLPQDTALMREQAEDQARDIYNFLLIRHAGGHPHYAMILGGIAALVRVARLGLPPETDAMMAQTMYAALRDAFAAAAETP